jgi:hypothetical protein
MRSDDSRVIGQLSFAIVLCVLTPTAAFAQPYFP